MLEKCSFVDSLWKVWSRWSRGRQSVWWARTNCCACKFTQQWRFLHSFRRGRSLDYQQRRGWVDTTFLCWSVNHVNGNTVTDMLRVAVHEIGHVLGLKHSPVKSSIMHFTSSRYVRDLRLHSDDINGIQVFDFKFFHELLIHFFSARVFTVNRKQYSEAVTWNFVKAKHLIQYSQCRMVEPSSSKVLSLLKCSNWI